MNKERYNQIIDEAYEKYADSHWIKPTNPGGPLLSEQLSSVIPMEHSKESFIDEIKKNRKFAKKWRLNIDEAELSQGKRLDLLPEYNMDAVNEFRFSNLMDVISPEGIDYILNESKVPSKIITVTYNNETIEVYEI